MIELRVRVLSDVLYEFEGKVELNDKPFTGYAFEKAGSVFTRVDQYVDGMRAPSDQGSVLAFPNMTGIDEYELEAENPINGVETEPKQYNGNRYDGAAFTFDPISGACLGAARFEDGIISDRLTWDEDGTPTYAYLHFNDSDHVNYSESGHNEGPWADVLLGDERMRFHTNKQGQLTTLGLSEGYMKNQDKFRALPWLPVVVDDEWLAKQSLGQRLMLEGEGINASLIQKISDSLDLTPVVALTLYPTALKADEILAFTQELSLKELTIRTKNDVSMDTIAELKRANPNCRIKCEKSTMIF